MEANDTTKLLQAILTSSQRLYNINLQQLCLERARMHPNPFVMYGRKAFSQSDEDGIIFEILRRLGLARGTFIELGVGTGVENNTLALAASKWRGEWFGGQSLAFDLPIRSRVHFTKVWIHRNNVTELIEDACSRLQVQSPV